VTGASAALVREAIERGDFASARELWGEYCSRLVAGGLTAEAMAEAAELVEWSRPILICARAHAAGRLPVLRAAGAYGASPPTTRGLVSASY